MAGQIWISPDFDEEDLDIIEAFEGKYANDEVVFEGFYIKPESPEGTGYPKFTWPHWHGFLIDFRIYRAMNPSRLSRSKWSNGCC